MVKLHTNNTTSEKNFATNEFEKKTSANLRNIVEIGMFIPRM
jgi:hypothetical protein